MKQKIFLTSTNADLREHRKAVADALERLGVEVIDGDEYVRRQSGQPPLKSLHEAIAMCDLFVGIYGRNYGSIPAQQLDGQANPSQWSYIEWEYSWAYERGMDMRLFFLAGDAPLPNRFQPSTEGIERLQVFRTRTMEHLTYISWHSLQDLLVEVLTAVGAWMRVPDDALVVKSPFGDPARGKQFHCDVFMAMPTDAAPFEPIYLESIKPLLTNEFGLTVHRGEDFFAPQAIIQNIWSAIVACKFMIAECSNGDANVFYEMGMAHTLGKPVIPITQKADSIPSDIRQYRYIDYVYTPPGMKQFEVELRDAVKRLTGTS